MGRKTGAGMAMAAMAALLAVALPSQAADEPSSAISPRVIDVGKCSKPEYPKADLRAGHTGQAVVLFLVAADGAVKDSKIARSSGYASLDEAARTALAQCRFSPAGDANEAPRWFPVSYLWSIEGPGGAEAGSMSRATQEEAFLWTARVLARYRYKPAVQASNASAPVLDRYLDALDPDHLLFTQSDLARFETHREQLARTDESRQLGTALTLYEQMRVRRTAMLAWTAEAIRGPLSALDSTATAQRPAGAPWPVSDAERRALWRQLVDEEVRSLRSAGSSDQDIVAILTRRNDNRLARVRALTGRDAFEVFMNAYVGAFDPHGAYFAPPGPASSRLGEPGQAGVGVVLKKQGEWVVVHDMARDGSTRRSGQVQLGDRIVAVEQSGGQPATDVVGWGLDEVIALLRGVPGTTVVLHVSPAGADGGSAPRRVALERGPASVRSDAGRATARVEVLERKGASYRIAVVTIPAFYEDFLAKRAGIGDYTSMAREVAELLKTAKAQNADAVLLDMRGNGGGSLAQAIGLAGLFLPRAPVALQRELDGKIKPEFTPEQAAVWDGPLAVLIDEGSAAATEIAAAAIQDHGRGLVIGDRSVGRTSVQTMISLDRFAPNPSVHYGELKMTVAQVYRISGETFEQVGVTPDVRIPGAPGRSGTARRPDFPAVPIAPVAAFKQRAEVKALVPALARRHEARTATNPSHQTMLRARTDGGGARNATGVDVHRTQLSEALHIVGDQLELLRTNSAADGKSQAH